MNIFGTCQGKCCHCITVAVIVCNHLEYGFWPKIRPKKAAPVSCTHCSTTDMSERSTSPSSVRSHEIPADLLAAAAQRRAHQDANVTQSMQEYEMRQAFRRLIDPGILRPNSKDVATASLKVLRQASIFNKFPIRTSFCFILDTVDHIREPPA